MRRNTYPRARVAGAAMKIIAHGNSLVQGTNNGASGGTAAWPAVMNTLAPLAGAGVTVLNRGVGGQGITQMLSSAATAVDANLDPTKLNVLMAWEFTNEVRTNGYNIPAAMEKWAQYCNERRAAAATANARLFIVTMTCIPAASAASQADRNARARAMNAVNVAMRANFRSYADAILDIAAVEPFATLFQNDVWTQAVFDAVPEYLRSDNGVVDSVHLGDAGYARVAAAAARSVLRVREI